MEHVAAGKSSQHVIQLWEQEHGLSEAVLESGGGGGGVVTMAWNPIPMPLQLCTVDASGRIRIWAKVCDVVYHASVSLVVRPAHLIHVCTNILK